MERDQQQTHHLLERPHLDQILYLLLLLPLVVVLGVTRLAVKQQAVEAVDQAAAVKIMGLVALETPQI